MDEPLLMSIFSQAWCRESSATPELWSPQCPSVGQCLSTAKIAKRYLGGEVAMMSVGEMPHFFNLLASGRTVDFTREQLPKGTCLEVVGMLTDEDFDAYASWFPEIASRYRILQRRFMAFSGASKKF